MNYYDRAELERLEQKANNLDVRVTRLEADVINIWKEINDLWSIVIEILKDIELLKVRISDIEDRMDLAEKEIDQLFQEITYIWGDESYRNNHDKYNLKKAWDKITNLDTRLTQAESDIDDIYTKIANINASITVINNTTNVIQTTVNNIMDKLKLDDPDASFLIVRWYTYTFEWGGATYTIEGTYVKIRDPNTNAKITIQAFHNAGGNYYWPPSGAYFPLPCPWEVAGFSIVASDSAILHLNDGRGVGACFGRYDGTKTVDPKTHAGIKPGGSGDHIAWHAIAIGI